MTGHQKTLLCSPLPLVRHPQHRVTTIGEQRVIRTPGWNSSPVFPLVLVGAMLALRSTPTLTLGVYAHVGLFDQTTALDALPDLSKTAPRPEAGKLAATGTARKRGILDLHQGTQGTRHLTLPLVRLSPRRCHSVDRRRG